MSVVLDLILLLVASFLIVGITSFVVFKCVENMK